ncbi:mucin-2-like [Ptychodera flava]|uniref:mucin-2-like n=1 Tax=Ptychodera flava TaxID=63121 RepID=UPI00396A2337
MGGIQVDKSLKNFIVIITALFSTMLLRGAAVDVRSAAPGTATTLLSLASMQLTSSFATSPGTTAVTQPSTNVHVEECSEWTEWMDDENGATLDPASIGEFELINQLRGPYGFCDEPTDIECALADDTNTPYNETGQVSLTCNLEQGFLCFHSQQSGDCLNYAIRVLCPAPCPSTQGNAVTTVSSTPVQLSAEYSSSPEVTMMPTTQSTACAEDENTDCSAETFTCPREFRLECNVTISSDTDLGMCLQHNITKASTEELWTTLNKTIPVCCFSANFTW